MSAMIAVELLDVPDHEPDPDLRPAVGVGVDLGLRDVPLQLAEMAAMVLARRPGLSAHRTIRVALKFSTVTLAPTDLDHPLGRQDFPGDPRAASGVDRDPLPPP